MEVRLSDRFCFREYNMYIVPKFMLTVSCDGNPIIYYYTEIKYTEKFAIRNVAAIYAHKPVRTAELEKSNSQFPESVLFLNRDD